MVFDHVKSFKNITIKCDGQRAVLWQGLVETPGYVMCKREKGRYGGVTGWEAMSGKGKRKQI